LQAAIISSNLSKAIQIKLQSPSEKSLNSFQNAKFYKTRIFKRKIIKKLLENLHSSSGFHQKSFLTVLNFFQQQFFSFFQPILTQEGLINLSQETLRGE
jgi:hypothetical protein